MDDEEATESLVLLLKPLGLLEGVWVGLYVGVEKADVLYFQRRERGFEEEEVYHR